MRRRAARLSPIGDALGPPRRAGRGVGSPSPWS